MNNGTVIVSNFEVVDFMPRQKSKSRLEPLHLELLQLLLKIPEGKSVRKPFHDPAPAKTYYASIKQYLKNQKLSDSYFVSYRQMSDQDGKFYVYIGKKLDGGK